MSFSLDITNFYFQLRQEVTLGLLLEILSLDFRSTLLSLQDKSRQPQHTPLDFVVIMGIVVCCCLFSLCHIWKRENKVDRHLREK